MSYVDLPVFYFGAGVVVGLIAWGLLLILDIIKGGDK